MSAPQAASTTAHTPNEPSSQRKRSRSASSSSAGNSTSERWSDLEDDDNWLEPQRLDDGRVVHSVPRRRAVTPEKITSATPLKDTNVGMRLLKLMGWVSGGLGPRGHGRAEPIPLPEQTTMGLGKASLDTRMLSELLERRPKVLESQKIATETEAERNAREAKITQQANIAAERKDVLAKFHCDVCNKTYANVAQWEEHLLSYGHNHAKRKRDLAMQSKGARNSAEEMAKRREKEKRREDRELARMLQVTGGKTPAATAALSAATTGTATATPPITPSSTLARDQALQPPPRKSGFFKVGDATQTMTGHPPVQAAQTVPPPPQTQPPALPSDARPLDAAQGSFARSAPNFVQAKSIAASFAGSATSPAPRPAGFRLTTQTPELHPLLRSDNLPATFSRTPVRNDLDLKPVQSTRTDERTLPPASTPSSTQRGAAKMQFVAASPNKHTPTLGETAPKAGAMKLATKSSLGASAFGPDDGDDVDMEITNAAPLGRPKAVLPKSNFASGFRKLG